MVICLSIEYSGGYSARWPSECRISKAFYCYLNFILLSLPVKWHADMMSSYWNISTKSTAQSFQSLVCYHWVQRSEYHLLYLPWVLLNLGPVWPYEPRVINQIWSLRPKDLNCKMSKGNKWKLQLGVYSVKKSGPYSNLFWLSAVPEPTTWHR